MNPMAIELEGVCKSYRFFELQILRCNSRAARSWD